MTWLQRAEFDGADVKTSKVNSMRLLTGRERHGKPRRLYTKALFNSHTLEKKKEHQLCVSAGPGPGDPV